VHLASDGTHPPNPVRGVPLAVRVDGVAARFAAARETHPLPVPVLAALEDAWQDALAAPEWARTPVWIHGDLHPGNVIARDDRLVALIDFGDLTAGDPAYDLATAWLTFDRSGRSAFRAALDGRYDTATWRRARGWAAAFALILLQHSDDAPGYASLARDAAAEIATEAKST
ncbi:MAG TPA: phosphotransferase, partial [Microbacterium sp.]|uniref:phosphotransferase n=1 Tax=Microbacterium sp. TaxID=51671 RepID=UPI002B490298